jgi:hypothetical protein
MNHIRIKYLNVAAGFAVLLGLLNCRPEEEPAPKVPRNRFSMTVNGQPWQPLTKPDDPCYIATACGWRHFNWVPTYRIIAETELRTGIEPMRASYFDMQVAHVPGPGRYVLNGSRRGDFESFATFRGLRPDGTYASYTNDAKRKPMVVLIERIIPTELISSGIEGTFAGVLYNEADLRDSVIVENGRFSFAAPQTSYERAGCF